MLSESILRIIENVRDRFDDHVRKPYGHMATDCQLDFQNHSETIIREWNAFSSIHPSAGRPIDELSAEQRTLNTDHKWKAYFVCVYGRINPEARAFFPVTTSLSEKWMKEAKLVFFSTLEPGKHIPPHKGNNRGVIRAQIGIAVPDASSTGLRVEDRTFVLETGQLLVFDDTFEHEAWNKGRSNRTVLIIDSEKRFPHVYGLLNSVMLHQIKNSDYVRSALNRMSIIQ